ncbi:dienelactone hydrolase family protein [Anaerobacillus alkaliphilus]|uniref:Dienelactone hydrolase family protein n=1 Tax=Anaerobacillus alkaliphilus TaxID=1548597 RepID=A0A4Q0VXJ5_9BACI|nr:dienelactone hydrolase family protein [Anaerobacillus alkaliphilus]RXJ04404.1 dienelactone hydrolase family protein [Anaerobacillus alkaliphilus]
MIKLTDKNSDSVIIVIHEIYGINQHMKNFCESLSEQNFDVFCPDLYESHTPFEYHQEKVAYHHFMENVGFDKALHKIKDILSDIKNQYKRIFIVGFSVGATIAWLCSEDESVDGIVGYYGSRIRNYVGILPKSPVMLFFSTEEKSCNVDELISTLDKKNSKLYKFSGQHGFSDAYSSKYNEESAQKAYTQMMNFFQKLR